MTIREKIMPCYKSVVLIVPFETLQSQENSEKSLLLPFLIKTMRWNHVQIP